MAGPAWFPHHDKKSTSHVRNLATAEWYQDYTRFVHLKGLRGRSVKTYLGWAAQLAAHDPDQPLPDLDSRKVLDFLIHLQKERKLAGSTLNQAVCALRTFYRDHLHKTWKIWAQRTCARNHQKPPGKPARKAPPGGNRIRSVQSTPPPAANRRAIGLRVPAERAESRFAAGNVTESPSDQA